MGLRILMIGDNAGYMQQEKESLRKKDFYVYTCDDFDLIDEMITEVKPNLIFIDPQISDSKTTAVYNDILENVKYLHIPLVYTLAEDDIYLVNRKRSSLKELGYMICDNVIDAVKTALISPLAPEKERFIPRMPVWGAGTARHRATT